MEPRSGLVTVGIPTFNRVQLLARSIDSVRSQTYQALEIVISDNASTDATEALCQELVLKDHRLRYVRQAQNIGGTENFNYLLVEAKGDFFMWLGDDDWIDPDYIQQCLEALNRDASLGLVGGFAKYYRHGKCANVGRLIDIADNSIYRRLARYYGTVLDNGSFYSLYRTQYIRYRRIPNVLAGDWHFMADVLVSGGSRMLPTTSVHRELGGATDSYRKLVAAYDLPLLAAYFPSLYVARSAYQYLTVSRAFSQLAYSRLFSLYLVVLLACRPIMNLPFRAGRFFGRLVNRRS